MSPVSKDVACMANIHHVQLKALEDTSFAILQSLSIQSGSQTHVINDGTAMHSKHYLSECMTLTGKGSHPTACQ